MFGNILQIVLSAISICWLTLVPMAAGSPLYEQEDTIRPRANPAQMQLISTDSKTRLALLWASVCLAVFVAFIQSLVATMAAVAEDSRAWTFRFRLALFEHWWWTWISVLLFISLVLITLSFLAGNDGETLGILVLSSATAMAIVRYAVPAWRGRNFIENRWLAWTGASRTAIPREKSLVCGDANQWKKVVNYLQRKGVSWSPPTASDEWGWAILPPAGIAPDATEVLAQVTRAEASGNPTSRPRLSIAPDQLAACGLGSTVYNDGFPDTSANVSLQWGSAQGFRRRVSRAITSMPVNLLLSNPLTVDGYPGVGICLAMGVLGRNRGLKPASLVFDANNSSIIPALEGGSTWAPRPQKVLRSYYNTTMKTQYGWLGPAYIAAAAELALIFADCPWKATRAWLEHEMAQQDIELNKIMQQEQHPKGTISSEDLNAMYRSSYVSMVMSLNNMRWKRRDKWTNLKRPDLLCGALLLYAETNNVPAWWSEDWATSRIRKEVDSLAGEWREPMAGLLGLASFPAGMEPQTR
ncbi:hypothetical protein EV426DRAFT_608893 [Tirmania nivea]|nr:hypothetical protein EV426DRAFT_608893 [Tirmania nivea]